MKVTYNWLKDFVNIKISPQALAEKLTMAGIEVKSVEKKAGDFVFEIEITSNRPDWLSVIGIACEVAAITGKKLKCGSRVSGLGSRLSDKNRKPKTEHRNLKIEIEDKNDCPFYSAKIIQGVKIGPSPEWLRQRLALIGCRSVNNIVDVTNYILFEYGEPLHAFDLDKLVLEFASSRVLELGINIRRAKKSEKIVTIDGIERILDENVLIIAAEAHEPENSRTRELADKAIALAGIMGGKDSEVSPGTKNVLLEAAVFDPLLIRRGRQKLGMQTDSSYRFERGLDKQTAEMASMRAAQLITEIAGGRCVFSKGAGRAQKKPLSLNLNIKSVSKVLGVDIPYAKIKQILIALGFYLGPKPKNNLIVRAPSFRQDIGAEIDLIEEVARVFGYDKIPTTLSASRPQISALEQKGKGSLVKDILVGLGLSEAITYSLIDPGILNHMRQLHGSPVEITNPLSREQGVLRPTLIPGLIRCVAVNLNQKQSYINIFELAHTFSLADKRLTEEPVLGIALCGTKSWLSGQGLIKERLGLAHLKGIIQSLFARLGIQDYSFAASSDATVAQIQIAGQRIGVLIKLTKEALASLGIKNEEVVAAELSLDKIFAAAKLKKIFTALPLYPGIARDISIVVKDEVPAEEILRAIRAKAGGLLEAAKITDCYRGKHIPRGFQGLTISCFYRAGDRTLTEAEVNPAHNTVLALLSEVFTAQIR